MYGGSPLFEASFDKDYEKLQALSIREFNVVSMPHFEGNSDTENEYNEFFSKKGIIYGKNLIKN